MVENSYEQNIDLAMFNNGGLRSYIDTGNITRGEIFKLMPFENELVVVSLNKKEFQKLVEYYIKTGGQPISFGDSFNLNDTIFSILTSDYLANGGDKMIFFKNKKYHSIGVKIRDAIINYCQKTDTINPILDNRNLIFNYEF